MPEIGLDSGDYAPNPRQDGPDVQDKGLKKYNKIYPIITGYGIQEDLRPNRNLLWIG